MAPLSEDTMWSLQPEEPAFDDVQPMKPVQQDEGTVGTEHSPSPMEENPATIVAKDEREDTTEESILASSTNFCTNFFGTLLGRSKVCEHCQQKLVNSDERIKEKHGDIKIYFHPECKAQRTAIEERKKVLHTDLLAYFDRKEESARRAAEDAVQADIKSRADREALLANARSLEKYSAPISPPKKQGFFARLFGGCKSNTSVEI